MKIYWNTDNSFKVNGIRAAWRTGTVVTTQVRGRLLEDDKSTELATWVTASETPADSGDYIGVFDDDDTLTVGDTGYLEVEWTGTVDGTARKTTRRVEFEIADV